MARVGSTAAKGLKMMVKLYSLGSCHTRETEPLQDPHTGFLRTTAVLVRTSVREARLLADLYDRAESRAN